MYFIRNNNSNWFQQIKAELRVSGDLKTNGVDSGASFGCMLFANSPVSCLRFKIKGKTKDSDQGELRL